MSDCILCSGDLLLHIHKNQLYWYCDRCREQLPFDLPPRYHRSTVKHQNSRRYRRSTKKLQRIKANSTGKGSPALKRMQR